MFFFITTESSRVVVATISIPNKVTTTSNLPAGVYWPVGSKGKQYGVDFFYNIDEVARYCQNSQFHSQYAREYQHWWDMKFGNPQKRMSFGRLMDKEDSCYYNQDQQQSQSRKRARRNNNQNDDVTMDGLQSSCDQVSEFMSFNFNSHNNKENSNSMTM